MRGTYKDGFLPQVGTFSLAIAFTIQINCRAVNSTFHTKINYTRLNHT
jgi:hypothetical protein